MQMSHSYIVFLSFSIIKRPAISIFLFNLQVIIIFMEADCRICLNPYDLDRFVPMILCREQHLCCLQCSEKILSESLSSQRKCPECRQEISKATVARFRHYANILQQTKTHRQKMDILQSQAKLLPQYWEGVKLLSSFDDRNNKQYYQFLRLTAEGMIEQKKYVVAKTILKELIEKYTKYAERQFLGIGSKEQERGLCEQCSISWYKNRLKQGLLSAEDLLFFLFMRDFDYNEQKEWLNQVLSSQPSNFKLLYGYALLQHNAQHYQQALSLYKSVIELSPTFSKPFLMISFIHKKQNNPTLSDKFAKLCLNRQPDNIFALYLLSVHQKRKKDFRIIITKQPDYVRALNKIGLDFFNQNKYEKAQQIFKECCKQNQLYIKSFINLASTLIQLKKFKQVVDLLIPILKKQLTSLQKSVFFHQLAVSSQNLNSFQDAIQYFKRSIKQNSGNKDSQLMLAQLYVQKKDNKEALKIYSQYLESYPKETFIYPQLVTCCKNSSEYELAASYLKKWLELQPQNVTIYEQLALLSFKCSQWKSSINYYLKCLQMGYLKNGFYDQIIDCLFNLNQFECALKYVGEYLQQIDLSSDQFNKILEKANRINEARNKALNNKK